MEKWFLAGQSTNFGQASRIFFSATHLKMIDLPIYKCESCGKSFFEAGILRMHIHTVHDGHKDHKCETCGKSFTGKLYLKETYPYNSWKQQRLAKKITNVKFVHFLKQKIYVHTVHKGR